MPLLLVAMSGATSSFLLLVVMPLLLVAMPKPTSSFLLVVEMPLLLVAMPGAISQLLAPSSTPSSKALATNSDARSYYIVASCSQW